MDVTEALKRRRTTRGFIGQTVPRETILEIVELASLAPSNSNTQPWHVAIASGDTLNWKFFGAPHAAFISMPAYMQRAHACDLGIFLQTLMLLMTERGIASCPQGALAAFPDVVKRYLNIPEENAILVGLSFGYADDNAQINSAKMPRESLETIASFHW
ncbi:MAG: nitroreductase [Halieaceae bacterium]